MTCLKVIQESQRNYGMVMPASLRIPFNVPMGISLLCMGTTIILNPGFRYIAWLPDWCTKTKPSFPEP